MAWTYLIRSGEFHDSEGDLLSIGHSGFGDAMNDPARVKERNVGPIPPGTYRIGPFHTHPTCGPVSMRLVPLYGTDTHGRSGFLIHGPNRTPGPEDDSHGCIILARSAREALALTQDRDLVVLGDPDFASVEARPVDRDGKEAP